MADELTQPKIFGIGLNKTGTTTLGECGRILGLRCTSVDRTLLEDVVLRQDLSRVKSVVGQFDLFEDWPWPLIYKELDQLYPNSKFILTTRKSAEVWLESLKKHSMGSHPTQNCRKLAYGHNYPHRNEQAHLDLYKRHNSEARAYFAGRNQDFIELCWEQGDDLEKLCAFLNMPQPEAALPHANKSTTRYITRRRQAINRFLSFINY